MQPTRELTLCKSRDVAALRLQAGEVDRLTAAAESAGAALQATWLRANDAISAIVSAPQLRAMEIIREYGTINLSQLADELGCAPSSASRLCDRLVAAGLINRKASVETRREISLSLRPQGSRLLRRLEARRRAELATVLEQMTPTGARALIRGLEEYAQVTAQLTVDNDHRLAPPGA
jgi:DNA-binding MarR family transcriptional regulator